MTDQGRKLLSEIESISKSQTKEEDIVSSFHKFRSHFVNNLNEGPTGLERCELKNGQIIWMCPEHVKIKNAVVLTDSVKAQEANNDVDKYLMLDEIDTINLNDF